MLADAAAAASFTKSKSRSLTAHISIGRAPETAANIKNVLSLTSFAPFRSSIISLFVIGRLSCCSWRGELTKSRKSSLFTGTLKNLMNCFAVFMIRRREFALSASSLLLSFCKKRTKHCQFVIWKFWRAWFLQILDIVVYFLMMLAAEDVLSKRSQLSRVCYRTALTCRPLSLQKLGHIPRPAVMLHFFRGVYFAKAVCWTQALLLLLSLSLFFFLLLLHHHISYYLHGMRNKLQITSFCGKRFTLHGSITFL